MKFTIPFLIIVLLSVSAVYAVDTFPAGNINMFGKNISNTTKLCFNDGTCALSTSGFGGGNASFNENYTNGKYLLKNGSEGNGTYNLHDQSGNQSVFIGPSYVYTQADGGNTFSLFDTAIQFFTNGAFALQSATGAYRFFNGASNDGVLNFSFLSVNRAFAFPDKSGTIALTNDAAGGDASGTLGALVVSQKFNNTDLVQALNNSLTSTTSAQQTAINNLQTENTSLWSNASVQASQIGSLNTTLTTETTLRINNDTAHNTAITDLQSANLTAVKIGSGNLTLVACQNITGSSSNLCTIVDTDLNNYTISCSVSGTTSKTATCERSGGGANYTFSWTDIDTDTDTNTGGNMSILRVGIGTGNNSNLLNNSLFNISAGAGILNTLVCGGDSCNLTIAGTVTQYTDAQALAAAIAGMQNGTIVRAATGNCTSGTAIQNITINSSGVTVYCATAGSGSSSGGNMSQFSIQVGGQSNITVLNNTVIRFLSGTGMTVSNDTSGNITITTTITQYTDTLAGDAAAARVQNSTIPRNGTSVSFLTLNTTGNISTPANISAGIFYGAGTGLTGTASSLTAGLVTNGVYTTTQLANITGSDVNVTGTNANLVLILGNNGVTAATYGNGSVVPKIAIDSKGRVSTASNVTIAIDAAQIATGALSIARGGTGSSSYTTGSVPFYDGTVLNQNNLNFFWNDTAKRLCLGMNGDCVDTAGTSLLNFGDIDSYAANDTNNQLGQNVSGLSISTSRGTGVSPTSGWNGDFIGSVRWYIHNGTDYPQVASIRVFSQGNSSNTGSYMSFLVTNNATTNAGQVEAMRIMQNGALNVTAANVSVTYSATFGAGNVNSGVSFGANSTNATITSGDKLTINSSVVILGNNNTLFVYNGSNGCTGRVVLVAGAATVSTTCVTSNSNIFLTPQLEGGTIGALGVSARTNRVSFTITGVATDTSTVAWFIVEPTS